MRIWLARLVALAVVAFLPGCLSGPEADGELPAECPDPIGPENIAGSSPTAGGPGPATLQIRVLDESATAVAFVPVLAWWAAPTDATDATKTGDTTTAYYVRLRTDGEGVATVRAPAGVTLDIAAGSGDWTHDARTTVTDGATLELRPLQAAGEVQGSWDMPVTVGVMPAWDPNDLPWADATRLARVESLVLDLTWSNGPQGGADFGIAVGRPGAGFQYWNPQPEPTVGASRETLVLDGADFAEYGWDQGDGLSAGPSVSTGGFTVTEIPYTLAWMATFQADPDLGDVCGTTGATQARDVTHLSP